MARVRPRELRTREGWFAEIIKLREREMERSGSVLVPSSLPR